jgi:FKBP-type peptidyl-prolyl cis-trans isomerase 2
MSTATANDVVRVHYTGKLTNGQIFDSSVDREPLQFKLGGGQMIKGFDQAVHGMELQEKKTVTIPFNEAYGPKNEELIQSVPRSQLPEGLNPKVGQKLIAEGQEGQSIELTVIQADDHQITVDANHMLAGEDLVFEIELVEIN